MMTQDERLIFLLRDLLAERKEYEDIPVPDSLLGKAAAFAQPDECASARPGPVRISCGCRTLTLWIVSRSGA